MHGGKMPSSNLTGVNFAAGLAHHHAGRRAEAIVCYRDALAAAPDHPRILGLLGQLQIATGDCNAGLAHLQRAAELLPDHDETSFAHANACTAAGRHEIATGLYRALLARTPAHLGAALNLISLLRHRNETVEMRAVTLGALAHHPEHPHLLLALAVCELRDIAGSGTPQNSVPTAVLALLDRVLAVEPDLAEAHFLRGTTLTILRRPEEAVDAQYCAIALKPDHAAAHLNLGNALADLDRLDEAEEYCRLALAIDPHLVEAHVSLGYIYTRLCRLDLAIQACRRALTLSPAHVHAHWNLGIASLLAGDWKLGWQQYEWRKRPELYAAHFRIPRGEQWTGGNLTGRTLTICAEQGFGDAIQLARYLPVLAARGAKLILSCAAALIPLFIGFPDLSAVFDRKDALPDADLWVDQMSLPGLLGTTPQNVPGAAGYLFADPCRVAHWQKLLPAGPKAGLVWSGNPLHSNDRRRSIPACVMEELLNIPGVSWVSLQVGQPLPSAWAGRIFDAAPHLPHFAETAACIANLDFLIAVDTSVVHLAGAMGREVWTLLPAAPDWRWLAGGADTPWYHSMRLFRQGSDRSWSSVVHDVAHTLRTRLAEAASRAASLTDLNSSG